MIIGILIGILAGGPIGFGLCAALVETLMGVRADDKGQSPKKKKPVVAANPFHCENCSNYTDSGLGIDGVCKMDGSYVVYCEAACKKFLMRTEGNMCDGKAVHNGEK